MAWNQPPRIGGMEMDSLPGKPRRFIVYGAEA